jgi:hypothetical protein
MSGVSDDQSQLTEPTATNGLTNGQVEEDQNTAYCFVNQHCFLQGHTIPDSWILLDSQSTIDLFCNKRLLQNVRATEKTVRIHCNAGITTTNQQGELPGYGVVWYHPKGIANILSLARVKDRYPVTFNSRKGNEFIVHKTNGTTRHFKQSPTGLYYHDTSDNTGTALVNTVAENKANYSNIHYQKAVLARRIQKIIGRPSTSHFTDIVKRHLLPNCPVTVDDIRAAEDIFGPDVGALKGKTVRQQPLSVGTHIESIPIPILERYRDVILGGDVMYVNKIKFAVKSHGISSLAPLKWFSTRRPTLYWRPCVKLSRLTSYADSEYATCLWITNSSHSVVLWPNWGFP